MERLKYHLVLKFIVVVGFCLPLCGQSDLSTEFTPKAFKSIMYHDRYRTTQDTVLLAYLTFHPVSFSNDTLSMYLSEIFFDENGKMTITPGRVIPFLRRLIPKEPLQLLLVPLVVYMNDLEGFREDNNFHERFNENELKTLGTCGYQVHRPVKIFSSLQYR